ncbi:MAG: SpoIIE family protein phosphatase, partial [Planctomycetota bacterium]|nr:SpoIIE family protein phosphatase [Planctomycetota bacterium]
GTTLASLGRPDFVTDHQILNTPARAYLRSDGQFFVQVVRTLATACDRLHTGEHVDVVILDLNLSDSNGLETFTSLYRAFPDTPVVILSGQEDEELAVAAVREGAQDYVPKSKAGADTLARSLRYAIERNSRRLAERRNLLWELDLAKAREIQQHLLPKEPPRIDGFDIAGVCQPAEATGGDFFDFIPLAGGKWELLVADVSSHGFAPALIMVGARRMLRTCAQLHKDIAECLTIVNRAIVEDRLDSQFVTMFFARLDPACRTLTYTAAGHSAYLLNAHGNPTTLESSGLPLGLSPDSAYEIGGTVTLQPDDIVLLMTDGAYEDWHPAANCSANSAFST